MAMQQSTIIEIDKMHMTRGTKKILTDISFTVKAGEIVTIIGPNGAGKSSLLKALLGLASYDRGGMVVNAALSVGYMPQRLNIDAFLPLRAIDFLQVAKKFSQESLATALDLINIYNFLYTPVRDLSGGELQKLLLARAILAYPDLLVLDEPTQGLDVLQQQMLYKIVLAIRLKFNCAVIIVSHDLHTVLSATDTVICLNKHICCKGHPASIKQNPEFLALFHHEHNHVHDS